MNQISNKSIERVIELFGDIFSYESGLEDLNKIKRIILEILTKYKNERKYIDTFREINNLINNWCGNTDFLFEVCGPDDESVIRFLDSLVDN